MRIAKFWLIGFFLLTCISANSQVRLPQLISDGMVLQRDTKINVWGWASPSEKVTLKFNGMTYKTVTGANGRWYLKLSATKAGGPYNVDIVASNKITIKDVLVGDVWFCSGQSNMVTPMERVKEKYPQEIAAAKYPQIRNFYISTLSDVRKEHDDLPPGKWINANPKDIMTFGAVSYFFAKQLFLKYHVPIGIINASVGGTPIQAWISAEGIKEIPQYSQRLKQLKDTAYLNKITRPSRPDTTGIQFIQPDKGLSGSVKWYEKGYTPEGWHKFWMPGYWADQGVKGLNGVVWFRKEVKVPASMVGKPAKLFLGRIVDADETYVNGIKVGNITYQYPPRRYDVPAGVLKSGTNVIVVRITSSFGKGGFVPDKRYELTDGTNTIDMRGDWVYKVGQVFDLTQRKIGDSEGGFAFSAQNEPAGLYNTMVAPVTEYTIKGFVWYQGESNTANPKEYARLLPALIADWRSHWKIKNLPFVYAQLPNFMEVQYSPSESQWAELREAQLKALAVPNTGMAVSIDAGEWNDIHPLNKKDVGERLALAAEKLTYNNKIVGMGPVFQDAKIESNKIIISFSSIGSGLISKDRGELTQFAVAGANKRFVWANARIEGDKVIVTSKEIAKPMFVRYAWADNPEGANLYNKEGLPASPFRTDK